jgi:hypothetical protein
MGMLVYSELSDHARLGSLNGSGLLIEVEIINGTATFGKGSSGL